MYINSDYDGVVIQKLEINKLIFQQDYNREVNGAWWEARAKDGTFNAHLMNPIHVSLRNDGKYYVIDGRHRLNMLNKRGYTRVWCIIHIDLTYEEEAKLFANLNEAFRKVTSFQGFIALIESRDSTALDIVNILKHYNFHIVENDKIQNQNNNDYGKIRGVKLICSLYNNIGRSDFVKLFDIINETWGGQPASLQSEIIRGVAVFLRTYEDYKIEKDLINKWRLSSASAIVDDAKENFKDTKPGHKYAKELLRIFNSGKANKNRLPDLIDLVVLNKKSRKITKVEEDRKIAKDHDAIIYSNNIDDNHQIESNNYPN